MRQTPRSKLLHFLVRRIKGPFTLTECELETELFSLNFVTSQCEH